MPNCSPIAGGENRGEVKFAITTKPPAQPGIVRVKSSRDVYEEYESHPERKSADTDGRPAGRRTRGLLDRLHVHALSLTYVGKESNLLEDVENEIVHDWHEFQQEYRDLRADLMNGVLLKIPCEYLADAAGISTGAIRSIRNGHSRPTPKTRELLIRAAKKFAADLRYKSETRQS